MEDHQEHLIHTVDIMAPSTPNYDSHGPAPIYWNVHSTYNEGLRISDAVWRWMEDHRLEMMADWDSISLTQLDTHWGDLKDIGIQFMFRDPEIAMLFKLTWV
jgi:hypothetical protein